MSLSIFHACHFTLDGSLETSLVLFNITDETLCWTGSRMSDDTLQSCRSAIKDMLRLDVDRVVTAYGLL